MSKRTYLTRPSAAVYDVSSRSCRQFLPLIVCPDPLCWSGKTGLLPSWYGFPKTLVIVSYFVCTVPGAVVEVHREPTSVLLNVLRTLPFGVGDQKVSHWYQQTSSSSIIRTVDSNEFSVTRYLTTPNFILFFRVSHQYAIHVHQCKVVTLYTQCRCFTLNKRIMHSNSFNLRN